MLFQNVINMGKSGLLICSQEKRFKNLNLCGDIGIWFYII